MSSDSYPTFSVVVPTFRRTELLGRVLDAICAGPLQAVDTIVVYRPDDDPETARWIRDNAALYPTLQPVPIHVTGKVAAQNLALTYVTGDIVVMLDDDNVVRPGWLARILRHFDDPRVGAAGGHDIVHGPGGSAELKPQSRAGFRNFWGKIIGQHNVVTGPPRDVEVLKGCNWAIRRAALGTLRFDDRLLGIGAQAGDDYWFCLNLRHAGWRIVLDPGAEVDHYPAYKPDYAQGEWGEKKCYEWTANITAHNLAFLSPARKAVYILWSVLVGVRHCPGLYFTVHSLLKRPRSVLGQLRGGWRGFAKGLQMARAFESDPPGRAAAPGT